MRFERVPRKPSEKGGAACAGAIRVLHENLIGVVVGDCLCAGAVSQLRENLAPSRMAGNAQHGLHSSCDRMQQKSEYSLNRTTRTPSESRLFRRAFTTILTNEGSKGSQHQACLLNSWSPSCYAYFSDKFPMSFWCNLRCIFRSLFVSCRYIPTGISA
jgi:hypothetical protein